MIQKFNAQITMDINRKPVSDKKWEELCIKLEKVIETEFEKLSGIEYVEVILEEIN